VASNASKPLAPTPARSGRTAASGRAGLFALALLLVGWKSYSLASGNFRIQETWSGWDYALSFPQDLLLFAALYVVWDALLVQRGRGGLWLIAGLCFLALFFQCADARMKVRFLHPLSWQWIRYAIAEVRTIGPDYTMFTGGSYWKLALASFAALGLAFLAPWLPFARLLPALAAWAERTLPRRTLGLRWSARAMLLALGAAVFFVPAQPYGLHRNFVVASLLPIDKPVEGFDQHETRPSEEPLRRSTRASFAHTREPALAVCRGRNVVLYVIESLAREQSSLGSARPDTTPRLASMLAQGGVETSCYAQFANSAKATFGLLSGVYAAQTMQVLECEMEAMSGLPRALANHGYFTLCLTPQHLYYQGQYSMFRKLGFGEMAAFLDLQKLARARGADFDELGPEGRDDRLVFLWDHAQLPPRQPFFATYYTMSSHYPYKFPGQLPGSEQERHTRAVRYTDQVLGELLDDYRRRGIYENTLFVITADHGEEFRDGRFSPRHSSLGEDAHEVPLLFFAPGLDLSQLNLPRARHVDVLPTILDLLGLAPEGLALSGASLLDREHARPVFLQSYGTERTCALIDGSRKWIWNQESDTRWSLDLARDPRGRDALRLDAGSPPQAQHEAEEAVRRMREFAIHNEAFLRDLVAGRTKLDARD